MHVPVLVFSHQSGTVRSLYVTREPRTLTSSEAPKKSLLCKWGPIRRVLEDPRFPKKPLQTHILLDVGFTQGGVNPKKDRWHRSDCHKMATRKESDCHLWSNSTAARLLGPIERFRSVCWIKGSCNAAVPGVLTLGGGEVGRNQRCVSRSTNDHRHLK